MTLYSTRLVAASRKTVIHLLTDLIINYFRSKKLILKSNIRFYLCSKLQRYDRDIKVCRWHISNITLLSMLSLRSYQKMESHTKLAKTTTANSHKDMPNFMLFRQQKYAVFFVFFFEYSHFAPFLAKTKRSNSTSTTLLSVREKSGIYERRKINLR